MKKFSYFLVFYLFTFLPLAARDYVTVPGDMMNSRIYTLDNGLKVFLSVNKEKPRIQTPRQWIEGVLEREQRETPYSDLYCSEDWIEE